MSAALVRFACKFSRLDSLRGGMGSRREGEGRVLITQLMTSMSACISRDNEPNISAPSKTLLSVSTQQWKRRQPRFDAPARKKKRDYRWFIDDGSPKNSSIIPTGLQKKRVRRTSSLLCFLSLLYRLLLQKTAKTRSYLNKYVNLHRALIFELMVKHLRNNALWIQWNDIRAV